MTGVNPICIKYRNTCLSNFQSSGFPCLSWTDIKLLKSKLYYDEKGVKITVIILVTLLLTVMAAAIIIPVVFKDKIKEKVENVLNGKLTAKVTFDNYRLNLFRAFPNASFSLVDLSVTGTGDFEEIPSPQ